MSDRAAIIGSYVDVRGVRTAVETAGDGPAIVLVHTAGMDSTQWRYVLPELASGGFRGIAVDLPGHGKSEVPPGGPVSSARTYAEFIADLCAALGETSISIVGCSVGGDIALAVAAHHPDLARSVVACECSDVTKLFPSILLRMGAQSAGAPGWSDMFALNSIASVGTRIPADRLYQLEWAHRRASRDIANSDLVAWNEFDIRDQLANIRCPTLIVYGEADYFVSRERVLRTARSIRTATVLELPDVGHYPMIEDPGFGAMLLGFLRDGKVPARAPQGVA